MSTPCYRYPCDTACRRGQHKTDPQLHQVRVGSGKYIEPLTYAWSVSVVADGDDGVWKVRLRVGKTILDLDAGQEVEELVKEVTRAAMWQSRYVREDIEQELAATRVDLEAALDSENVEAVTS